MSHSPLTRIRTQRPDFPQATSRESGNGVMLPQGTDDFIVYLDECILFVPTIPGEAAI